MNESEFRKRHKEMANDVNKTLENARAILKEKPGDSIALPVEITMAVLMGVINEQKYGNRDTTYKYIHNMSILYNQLLELDNSKKDIRKSIDDLENDNDEGDTDETS